MKLYRPGTSTTDGVKPLLSGAQAYHDTFMPVGVVKRIEVRAGAAAGGKPAPPPVGTPGSAPTAATAPGGGGVRPAERPPLTAKLVCCTPPDAPFMSAVTTPES